MRHIPPDCPDAGIPRANRGACAITAAACVVLLAPAFLAAACSSPAARLPAAGQPGSAASRASRTPHSAFPLAQASRAAQVSPTAPVAAGHPPSTRPQCATSGLRLSVGQANGAAGSIYYPLVFTSSSAQTCTMFGYPGVSFVTGIAGRQLGGAAVRNATFAPRTVTLRPGATAHASLQVVIAQIYPAAICKPVTAHWLRVYPPGQHAPLYVRFTALTCTGAITGGSTLGIYVVRPGSSGP